MAMMILRTFLSHAHARALRSTGILDLEVSDFLLEERLTRIRAQITAALAIRQVLTDMGFEVPDTIDLLPLVVICKAQGIFGAREAKVLMQLNKEANEAKHQLVFASRL